MRLLFDLDGTLTDSFLGITNCIRHALTILERTPPLADELRWCIGPPLQKSFYTLLDTSDDDLVTSALKAYRDRFGTVGLFENALYPGIIDALEALIRAGHVLSVATSKPEVFARQIIEHFGLAQYFCAVDGSELDGTRCDKSALIAHILERDDLDHQAVVMIGDRAQDMIGATANQVCGIGALWGYGSLDELQDAGASQCIADPSQLVDVMLQMPSPNLPSPNFSPYLPS